jgi:uncharacterized SAM-binding protein YcdF (DUF218 family)
MVIKASKIIINLLIRPGLVFAGLLCIWYYFALLNFIGHLRTINLIWIFIGAFFILIALFFNLLAFLFSKMHKTVKVICASLLIVFLLSLGIIEGLIFFNARSKNYENADYVIILGAGLFRGGPSLTLLRRINSAIKYANNNPDVKIIVSGGFGEGMRISEAEVMSRVLLSNGIREENIIMEDRSTNTYENLKYSGKLISDFSKKVVISSSEFHLFRAKIIAGKIGYKNIGTLASWSPRILLPNYYLREYFAIVKTLIVGN